jgi:hypothetical protein
MTEFDEYLAIEQWVKNANPSDVRLRLSNSVGNEKNNIELAIMTYIAIGDRPELEAAFPDFAHANPVHTFGR